ncbi:MAG: hypothetical protein KF826_05255 [Xanthobacteraceae bacterium]|uniref:hypothetical protein n=1 Tax=Pseudorhodoplanes sp. TaxID=1934341 RepID=UPI001DBCEB8D|nr:hypothetical protein [Xanthobacteraceae bacterium]MBX3523433.1 hypothetical protein [Xanthobacteraceae bacterium]MBX3533740.1 hypothetical protein [Xanthobacteraceae bacterium]MBX3549023.1 hypothetical protein [Xanthobacteraceae bacterium]MCW5675448.1 hypothetical protein [Xanthobacteraceae bacterium]
MSDAKEEAGLENDHYAVVERSAEIIWRRTAESISKGEVDRISDRAVVTLFTAAVKLYAQKCGDERTFRPLAGRYDEIVTATEALTVATELLRALRLGPTEFALWARRRPEDYYDLPADAIEIEDQQELLK